MKTALLALALITAAPLAQAQIVIQAPPILEGPRGPVPELRRDGYRDDYWRHREGERDEWRRRAEFRDEEHRRMEWRRAHCVRDYRGQEYCRQ